MTTNLGLDVELPLAFGDAVARVKDALKQEARDAGERMARAAAALKLTSGKE